MLHLKSHRRLSTGELEAKGGFIRNKIHLRAYKTGQNLQDPLAKSNCKNTTTLPNINYQAVV